MATIVEFDLPAEEFALYETLEAVPDAEFEVERVVADATSRIVPYVWVRTDDFDALEAAFENDPTVSSITALSETDDDRSYRMEWDGPIDLLIHIMTEQQGTITHARGSNETWTLRVLFPERTALSRAHEFARERGFSLDVRSVYQMDDERGGRVGLTEIQHDVLVAAFKAGYFKVPREVSLKEFSEQQGVSHQAMSERLRRGVNTLIEHTLITGEGEGQGDE